MNTTAARILAIPPLAFTTIAVDFDVPIHLYSQGVHDGTCYDGPTPGALETLAEWMRTRPVAVFTARPLDLTWEWFDRHAPSFPVYPDHGLHREYWDELGTLLLTNRKIVAQHYVDDRALRYTPEGGWDVVRRQVAFLDQHYRELYTRRAREAEPCD